MSLVIDSVEYLQNGAALFKSVHIQAEQNQITTLYSMQQHAASLLIDIAAFRRPAQNRYVALDGLPLFGMHERLVYLPAHSILPPDLRLKQAFDWYGCSWALFKEKLPTFGPDPDQKCKTLSSGEQRLCSLHLCLHLRETLSNRWLLLDQPFKHLAPVMIDLAIDWLMHAKQSAGILLTDTVPDRPGLVSDKSYELRDGRVTRS